MRVVQATFVRLDHIHLRVRSLGTSVRFYRDLLGLNEVPSDPHSNIVRVLAARTESGNAAFRIALTEGLPAASELAGVDHFSLAVRSEEDVEELHRKALAMGINATQPRIYAGAYQTFLFDPDGYKIEVLAGHSNDAASAQADE